MDHLREGRVLRTAALLAVLLALAAAVAVPAALGGMRDLLPGGAPGGLSVGTRYGAPDGAPADVGQGAARAGCCGDRGNVQWRNDVHDGDDAGIAPDFVRVRIVANSDSAYDQEVKEVVRDAVRARLGPATEGFGSADQAMAEVERMLPDLREEIAAALAATGCPYDCSVEAGRMPFPAKSYGGLIVPPGEYPALCVTLGQGSGANWWCVLFPPLCFVDVGSSLAVFADAPAGAETAELRADLERAAARPQLRSWLWEKLRESGWLKRLLGKAEARDAR